MAVTQYIKNWAGSAENELFYLYLALRRPTVVRYEMPNFLSPSFIANANCCDATFHHLNQTFPWTSRTKPRKNSKRS
jgi:hypothetical protein